MKHSHASGAPTPEFSRRVVVEEIADDGTTLDIVAEPEERAALGLRFGLLGLGELRASLTLRKMRHGLVRVEGRFSAKIQQRCVVTLEPVTRRIDDSFVVVYGAATAAGEAAAVEVIVAADEDGPPEPFEDGAIDLGEAVAQQLALAIDPFPRAPNASLDNLLAEIGRPRQGAVAPDGPFSALAEWKPRR